MISSIFTTLLYQPLYNGLVFLMNIVPWADVGFAVVLLTIIVKTIIFPLTHKGTKTQAKLKELEPEIKQLRETHKNDQQTQAQKIMELYKEHGVNPFSGCLSLLIQLPIIFALYWVFWRGISVSPDTFDLIVGSEGIIPFSVFNADLIYSFITPPESVRIMFLGVFNLLGHSIVLAVLAGITQFVQIRLSMPADPNESFNLQPTGSTMEDFKKSMRLQMRYGLPIIVGIAAYFISAAVALYWLTNNLYMIAHEMWVRKKAKEIQ